MAMSLVTSTLCGQIKTDFTMKATFLEFDEKSNEVDKNQLMLTIPQNLRGLLVRLNTHLGNTLPSYMVPAIYCP